MSRFTPRLHLAAALVVGTLGLTGGCDRSPEAQQQKAMEAQQKASQKTAEAMSKANEKANTAINEGSEKAAEAYGKANRVAEKEATKAAEKTTEAQQKTDETAEKLRQKFEKEIGSIDKRIVDVRTKLSNAPATKGPRDQLARTLNTVQDRSTQIREKLDELTGAAPTKVEATKQAIETEIAEVKQTLDSLESQT